MCDGLGDEPPAFVIGGWEAADEQGVAERGQIVLGHQRRIGDVDVGARRDPVLRQERRDVRQEGVVDGFIRGIAIVRFAPEGDGPVDAQGREDELLQIWPLVFAIAMGNRKGDRLLLLVLLSSDGR